MNEDFFLKRKKYSTSIYNIKIKSKGNENIYIDHKFIGIITFIRSCLFK